MRIAVLGAGVVGVTTAYFLSSRDHQVDLIDRASSVAAECSFANGAQLSYSFVDAMGSPELLMRAPSLLFNGDPAIRLSPWRDPAAWRWCAEFMMQCTKSRHRENSAAALRLSLKSAALFQEHFSDLPIDFDYRPAGKLVLLTGKEDARAAEATVARKRAAGCDVDLIDIAAAIDIEPALAEMPGQYAAAIYSRNDAVGDARLFSEGLANWLTANRNVTFRLNTDVRKLAVRDGRCHAVQTESDLLEYDAVVVCLGVWSPQLLQDVALRIPVYPVHGYSATFPATDTSPLVNITDADRRIVFSKIGDGIRVAGFADIVGFHNSRRDQRISRLIASAKECAPNAANFETPDFKGWNGMRPMTPSNLPIVGKTAIDGLYLNTGHGMLGWTFAAATGATVAGAVTDREKTKRLAA